MSHIPSRSPMMGARATGDLSKRKAPGNQSMNGGGRYDNRAITQIAEADSKVALKKAQQKKAVKAGQGAEPIIINPDKNIIAQGIGN